MKLRQIAKKEEENRQIELLSLLEIVSREIARQVKDIKMICWNYRVHSTQPIDISLMIPLLR
jgi:hypothetical protein